MARPTPFTTTRSLYAAMPVQYAVGGAFLPFVTLYLRDRGLELSQIGWVFLSSAAVAASVPFLWGFVADNLVAASLDRLSKGPFVDAKAAERAVKDAVADMNIKIGSTGDAVSTLSGGNQQKVVIAKWLTAEMDVLIFDEPTRGIDVGAKQEIYHLLNELVAEGKAIIMISSELPEILRMSHRILVMCEGRLTGELSAEEADQEKIMTLATQRESVAEIKDLSRA